MVSLVDIGTLKDVVPLRGKDVEITGVSAKTIVQLLSNSDELRRVLAEKSLEVDMLRNLVEQAPLAVAQFIAAGTGKPDDAATIDFAYRELVAGETYDLLKGIAKLTFPRGVKSFIEELTALAQEGRGWGAVTKSPVPSNAASGQDTTSTDAGPTPQGS